jgi:shikimate dehydrogenase
VITGTTRLVGLLGHPVEHSLSPEMHNNALRALAKDAVYLPLPVAPENLREAVAALRAFNFIGANVTIPHKHAVIKYLDSLSPACTMIQACNTIINRDGKLHGETTDPEGMLKPLQEHFSISSAARICILGNGGSARTAAFALALLDSPPSLVIAGRSLERVEPLVEELRVKTEILVNGYLINSPEFNSAVKSMDVVINCTPVGMYPNLITCPLDTDQLRRGTLVYDNIYNPQETVLLRKAAARGCKILGGREMLIEQARASFKLWFGELPPLGVFTEPFERRFGKH